MKIRDVRGTDRNFSSLSTKDLLEARDQYHWQLLNKRNVVGTAIGLYRIRKTDPWPTKEHSEVAAQPLLKVKTERTFANSEIRDYSWPCVLVLVDEWLEADQFGLGAGQTPPDALVPKTLYMPDGRAVPVCVVKVTKASPDPSMLPVRTWPKSRLGGGFPLISTSQGEENFASVGALVTDGHTIYALTSRHVAGPKGHEISSLVRGETVPVGKSSARHLTRMPFSDVYTDFPSRRSFLTLDAGLIQVNEVSDWTSQTYGLPQVGELADLNELNITVRLIGAEVRAFGAASGELRGEIAALFYRYRSIGGYDDITDFLIEPLRGHPNSRPGDSGTIWHLVQEHGALRPIALQWGGQTFLASSGKHFNFALATSLTNVLRLLEVDLVVEFNTNAQPYWGKTGHYTIATFACGSVRSKKLAQLMSANSDRISFRVEGLGHTNIDTSTAAAKKAGGFVPLADVPDLIWKSLPAFVPGGRDTSGAKSRSAGPEHPNHFADIDEPRPSDGKTLRQLCVEDPKKNVDVAVWQDYYTSLGHKTYDKRGLLPFRVWQFFDAMVDAAKKGDLASYLAAAGLVAHYVGDASQTLHGSYVSNGIKGEVTGVHSAYETTMIDRHDQDVIQGIQAKLPGMPTQPLVKTGKDAAVAVVALMDRAAQGVDPMALNELYATTAKKKDDTSVVVTDALWTKFADPTMRNMADSVTTLAMIWDSAWKAGGGDSKFATNSLVALPDDQLKAIYENPALVPSLDLDHVAQVLK